MDEIDTAIETRKYAARFGRREWIVWNRKQQRPVNRQRNRKHSNRGDAIFLCAGRSARQHDTPVPAGSDVIGMTFARRSFGNDPVAVPFEAAKYGRHRYARQYSGSRRAATHTERDVIVESNLQRNDWLPFALQQSAVGIDDKIPGHLAALLGVAAVSGDRKL